MMKEILTLFGGNSSIKFSELLYENETFEEPPLINYATYLKKLDSDLYHKDIGLFLFNLAYCHLHNTKLYAAKKLSKEDFGEFFICITYVIDVDNDLCDVQMKLPNFWVTRKKRIMKFLKEKPRLDFNKYPEFNRYLNVLGIKENMRVLCSHNDDFDRFYFVCEEDFESL